MNCSQLDKSGGMCLVCYDECTPENSIALKCGHTFTKDCWFEYLESSVNEGPDGISAKCMQIGCNLKVGHTVFDTILA